MFLLHLTRLTFAATASIASPALPSAQITVADSEAVLTVDALTRMTKFWTNFEKLPDSIKTTGKTASQKDLTLIVGPRYVKFSNGLDMTAMATKYPTVTEALKQSGLTGQQWEAYRDALFSVYVARQMGLAPTISESSVLGKNIAFFGAHQHELDALIATGMTLPRGRPHQGADANDLNP